MPILKGDKIFPFSLHNLFDYLQFVLYLCRCQFERKGISLTARRPIARREKPKLEKRHKRTINQFINQHKN